MTFYDGHGAVTTCRGPACMAWRWSEVRIHRPYNADQELVRLGPDWKKDEVDPDWLILHARGYCGLAGKP